MILTIDSLEECSQSIIIMKTVVLDLDVLANDFFIRFQFQFDSDETKRDFLEKSIESTIMRKLLVISDHESIRMGSSVDTISLDEVDKCIFYIESFLNLICKKSVSEIFTIVHDIRPKLFHIYTLPLDD